MRKLCVLLIVILFSNTVFSQENDKNKLWINTNAGVYGSFLKSTGASFGIGSDFLLEKTSFSLKYNKNLEYQEIFADKNPWEKFNEYGILIGRMYSDNHAIVRGSIGTGLIVGTQRGRFINKSSGLLSSVSHYEEEYIIEPTLLFEIKVLYKLSNYFGMNLTYYVNYNNKNLIGVFSIGLDARIF